MTITLKLKKEEVVKALTDFYNLPDYVDVDFTIEDDAPFAEDDVKVLVGESAPFEPVEKFLETPEEKEEPKAKATPEKKVYYFETFLQDNGFTCEEAAKLCNVSKSTIKRVCSGFFVRNPTYLKIIRGLEMTNEQAQKLKRSLTRHQVG